MRTTRSARASSGANSRTQVSPVACAAATTPSMVTICPTWFPASCQGYTGGAAAAADRAPSAIASVATATLTAHARSGRRPARRRPADPGAAARASNSRPPDNTRSRSPTGPSRGSDRPAGPNARAADRTGRCLPTPSRDCKARDRLTVPVAHAAAPAAATTPAGGPLAGLAHRERPAAERLAVQRVHGGLRLGVRRHLDEGEAPGAAGLAIGHDLDLFNLTTVLLEEGAQLVLVHLVRQVPDVQSLSHSSSRFNGRRCGPPSFRTNGLLACPCRQRLGGVKGGDRVRKRHDAALPRRG